MAGDGESDRGLGDARRGGGGRLSKAARRITTHRGLAALALGGEVGPENGVVDVAAAVELDRTLQSCCVVVWRCARRGCVRTDNVSICSDADIGLTSVDAGQVHAQIPHAEDTDIK